VEEAPLVVSTGHEEEEEVVSCIWSFELFALNSFLCLMTHFVSLSFLQIVCCTAHLN
jgi:hypothetical protein